MKKNALNAISLVAVLTVIAKGLGMLRDILQARAFGVSSQDIELFTTANNLTIYLFTTAAYALCLAAIPIFSKKQAVNKKDAMESANNLITVTLLGSVLVMVGMLIASHFGLFGSQTGESGQGIQWYTGVMIFTLPLILLTYLLVALFHAMGYYFLQGSLSLLYNIVICVLLLLFGKQMNVPAFAVLTSVAWILQLVMVLPTALKEKYRFSFHLNLRSPDLRIYWKTAFVTVFTTSAYLLCYLLDTRQSAGWGLEATASFSYAEKLFTPIATTLVYSVGAVVFPKWSESYARMEQEEYRSYVGKAVENTTVLLLPLSVVFSMFGTPIIRVLFEGGNFDAASSVKTGLIFSAYMMGLAGFALLDLLSKAFYATGKTKAPLLINLGVVVLNFVLNYILLNMNAPSYALAASTALAMTIGGIALACAFFGGKAQKIFSFPKILKGLLLSAAVFGMLLVGMRAFVFEADSKLLLILKCGAMGVVAIVLYLAGMYKDLNLKCFFKKEERK